MSSHAAARWPSQPALHDLQSTLTFAELHRAVIHFTATLLSRGVKKGDRVAILGTKQVATVIAILAASRAGAVYVPIDPRLPEARVAFMLDDADVKLVVGPTELAELALGRPFVATDGESAAPTSKVRLPRVRPEDPAYMMYTSGSTGLPKAVVIEHRQVRAFFEAHNAFAQIAPGDRCMNTGSFHFDVSILDVFLPLYFGASVVLTPELPMPTLLLSVIARHRITHFYAVGTVLQRMTGDGTLLDRYDLGSLRLLQTGAERCNPRVVNQWLRRLPQLAFLNSYGPTEVTVGCVCYKKPDLGPLPVDDVPIGQPHPGTLIALRADDGTRIRAPNVVGELLVAGPQIMRGYWRRPREQAGAFVELDGVRFYRTGDQAFVDEAGWLRFVGRRDDCVKVEGVRVHLSEVEKQLEAHPRVTRALAYVVRDAAQRARVACALTLRGSAAPALLDEILVHARARLGAAVVPAALVACADVPRTSSGKADLRRLAALTQQALQQALGRALVLRDGQVLPCDLSVHATASTRRKEAQ